MRTSPQLERASHLSPEQVDSVVGLAIAAGDADGVVPLSEHVLLHLRHGGDEPSVHLLIHSDDGSLVAYAHVDTTDAIEGASAELVVHPMFRRHGLGRALVMASTEAAAEHDTHARLRLWAHGDHPSASALALSLGFERHRVLLQMRRSLHAPIAAPTWPDRVEIRPFAPGVDDEAWVAVNARAFAELSDQGRWTIQDLRVRMAEPWFEAAGFLMAWRDGHLLGFHWTKVHGSLRDTPHSDSPRSDSPRSDSRHADSAPGHDHDPVGEVYVLGVDPSARGLGLGMALTLAGLCHLRARGLEQVKLYVDESNPRAITLYQRNGFVRWTTDVCFRRPLS